MKSMYESNSEEQMKKLGCFEACVFQKLHFMDGNTLNVEKLESGTRELTPDDFTEDVHEIIEQCVSKVSSSALAKLQTKTNAWLPENISIALWKK
uniref:Odorant binding protein 4 n=1 Tax=Scaptotrigona mexicana TaxID=596862 RepID=A0AAU8HMC4_9HYME